MAEKTTQHGLELVETQDHLADLKSSSEHAEEVRIARLTEDDFVNLSAESLKVWSPTGFRLALIQFVHGCNQAGYGIDWAVIGGINAIDRWHDYFGFGTSGTTLATINALMTIGLIVGAPFLALADVVGRRGINFTGNAIVIFAALLQGLSTNLKMFMAGRFFLGFGCALMSSPQYMGEIAPSHLRGVMVGIFGACFQIGSLGMNGAMIGFSDLKSDWSWRIPLLLEGLFPTIFCLTVFFLTPESPRFLVLRGKKEAARKVIAQYHTTEGTNVDHPLVYATIEQIEESLASEAARNKKPWDYSVFFTKRVLYRHMLIFLYSCFQQWNGGGIIGMYLVPALETIGVDGAKQQLGIQLGLTATYFVFTLCGSYLVDKVTRRFLIFSGLISFILVQTAATITSWQYDTKGTKGSAYLTIFWMFLFQTLSSLLIATMHNLYPVELLSLQLRAKGMGLYNFWQGACGTANNYGISVGINKIGYKIWVVFIGYNAIQLVLSYFIFPETSGLSLEEIDNVFETPGVRPVKMSLDIAKAKKEKARLDRERAQHGEL